jgi:hypothetical protein
MQSTAWLLLSMRADRSTGADQALVTAGVMCACCFTPLMSVRLACSLAADRMKFGVFGLVFIRARAGLPML